MKIFRDKMVMHRDDYYALQRAFGYLEGTCLAQCDQLKRKPHDSLLMCLNRVENILLVEGQLQEPKEEETEGLPKEEDNDKEPS